MSTDHEGATPRRCGLYDPTSDLICDQWYGHDGGMHTPVVNETAA